MINNEKLNDLIKVIVQTEEELLDSLDINLVSKYGRENVISTSDYILALGNIPIMLVAHLDTVHNEQTKKEDIVIKGDIISSPKGIGGDDRCGVFMINEIIKQGHRPYVLFTTQEERGCIGAKAFTSSPHLEYIKNLKYMIQLDRRDNNDAVFYDCKNQEFINFIINNYAWDLDKGTYTDIVHIAPKVNIAGVNLSCGYFNAHRKDEYIDFGVTLTNTQRVIKMLEDGLTIKSFPFY